MARKKKEEEEEVEDFAPPPFDEKHFYRTEREGSKAALLAALWGFIAALLSTAALAATRDWVTGAIVGVVAALALKLLLDRAGVTTKDFDNTKWMGTGSSYFLCWLAFWILLVNPPVMDLSAPVLADSTPDRQELGSTIKVLVTATDNSGVGSVRAELRRPDGGTEVFPDMDKVSDRLFRVEVANPVLGKYTYEVRATDGNGHATGLKGSFEVVPSEPPLIELIAPTNGSDITYDQSVLLHIKDNAQLSGVWYTLDSSTERIYLRSESKRYQSYPASELYKVRPDRKGHEWIGGTHAIFVSALDAAQNTATASYNFTLK